MRSKGAILVLVWSVLAWACYASVKAVVKSTVLPSNSTLTSLAYGTIDNAITITLYPIAGWVADVHLGRRKVMKASLWLMWVGTVLSALLLTVNQIFVPEHTPHHTLMYIAYLLAYVLVICGYSGITVMALPFGTDQMLEASSEEISAYVHWFIWTWFAGEALNSLVQFLSCTSLSPDMLNLVFTFSAALFSSTALCLDSVYRHWLSDEYRCQNPFKLVYSVLKYAVAHTRPTRRSALTYSEERIPSRVDLGKSRYGGPFTTEQVEDVKTFLRLLVVICAVSILQYTGQLYRSSNSLLISHFQDPLSFSKCFKSFIDFACSGPVIIVIGFPLHELAIYPLIRRWFPSMLKRVGIAALLTLVYAITVLSLDVAEHVYNKQAMCMFSNKTPTYTTLQLGINYLWVNIPSSVLEIVLLLIYNASLMEFILAQTPYSMKGLLIGTSYSITTFFQLLSVVSLVVWIGVWQHSPNPQPWPTCGFWFYLFAIVVTVAGLVLFCVLARWYKKRERNEPQFEQRFVEQYYDKYIQQKYKKDSRM